MAKITVELELGPNYEQDEDGDFYPVDGDDFDTQIKNALVEKLMRRIDYKDKVALEKIVAERADAIINGEVQRLINEVVASPLHKYDYMGKPTGEAFTINQLIVEAIEKFAAAPDSRDSYNRNNKAPNLSGLVSDTVTAALREELAPVIKEVRKKVTDNLTSALTARTAEAVATGR